MLRLTRNQTETLLACKSAGCGSTDLSSERQGIVSVFGAPVWFVEARCGACDQVSRWKWTSSVDVRAVEPGDGDHSDAK